MRAGSAKFVGVFNMHDRLTKDRRSWNMSRIPGKNTKPEKRVRSELHRLGYRFRIHRNDLPGKPDIVFVARRIAVFVHGCFWHRHRGCKNCTTPSNNRRFWLNKFGGNISRDSRNRIALRRLGWKCIVIWECETEDFESLRRSLARVTKKLNTAIT